MIPALLVLLLTASVPASARVKTGLEVLASQQFAPLKGKRVGIITNHTGTTSDYRRAIDLLASAPGVKLAAIFTPEHGITGTRDDSNIESGRDAATGVPIHSLYSGPRRRPDPQSLKDLDALVFDIQDVGARFYTYITTLGYMIEEAARLKIPIYVLDRPNPINGLAVEGPLLDDKHVSFVGYMRMPVRHGMTVGELARMFNGEKQLGADVRVIQMEGWRRSMWLDETGLPWVNPSPNMRSLVQAILYPGLCLLEGRQVSVGRGTDTPFQIIGAPWLSPDLASYLNSRKIAGVSFIARRFQPDASDYKGQECEGLEVLLTNRDSLNSVALGMELAGAVMRHHPGKFEPNLRLLGSEQAAARLKKGDDPRAIVESWKRDLDSFRSIRAKYLIYK